MPEVNEWDLFMGETVGDAVAQRNLFRDALKKWGEHSQTCDSRRGWNAPDRPCDCGLDAVLKVAKRNDGPARGCPPNCDSIDHKHCFD